MLSDATYSYRYDDEGNQTARTVKDTGVREALAWDHRNRLSSIASLVPREIAHWRFDGNAENATGNANFDGMLVGDTHYDDADPVRGETGNEYLVLDGNGDYVSLGNDDEFKIRTLSVSLPGTNPLREHSLFASES